MTVGGDTPVPHSESALSGKPLSGVAGVSPKSVQAKARLASKSVPSRSM